MHTQPEPRPHASEPSSLVLVHAALVRIRVLHAEALQGVVHVDLACALLDVLVDDGHVRADHLIHRPTR